MYKIAMMFRFLPTVDQAAARERWSTSHADLVAAIPGVLRYTQGHPVEALPVPAGTATDAFDGYVAHWYEDRDALERAMASPEWAATGEDAAAFIDFASSTGAAVEE